MSIEADLKTLQSFLCDARNIFDSHPLEFFSSNDQALINNYLTVLKILESKSSPTEVNKIIQQKILSDPTNLEIISTGLLYCILSDQSNKSQEYFDYLKFLSNDGLSICTFRLKELLEIKFFELKETVVLKIPWIIDQMVKMDFIKIVEVITTTLRNILYGDFTDRTRAFSEKLFSSFKSNLQWISRQNELAPMILFKAVRLYSGFSYLPDQSTGSLKRSLMEVIVYIWNNNKQECVSLGREFIRVLQEIFRHAEFRFFIDEMSIKNPSSNRSIYVDMLYNCSCPPNEVFSRVNSCMRMLIPPLMESMLLYSLAKERAENLFFYIENLLKKFRIFQGSSLELLLSDILRYLINQLHPSISRESKLNVMKRLLLFPKNEVAKSFMKQSLLLDWLYYIPGMENIAKIEPGIYMIFEGIYENKAMTEGLLNFLFLYCKEFDPSCVQEIRKSISFCLRDLSGYGIVQNYEQLTLNININERLRHEFMDFLNPAAISASESQKKPIRSDPRLTNKPNLSQPQKDKKPEMRVENLLSVSLREKPPVEEMISLRTESFEEFMVQEEEMFGEKPDFEEKQRYDVELPVYQADQNKEMFLNECMLEMQFDESPSPKMDLENSVFVTVEDNEVKESPLEELKKPPVPMSLQSQFLSIFKTSCEKLLKRPEVKNLEKLLEEFIEFMNKNKSSIYNDLYEVFYEEFAKVILNCFQSHFSDFTLEISDNVAIFMIKKLDDYNLKSKNSFQILEKLIVSINGLHKLFSAFYLEYMIAKRSIEISSMKEIYSKIFRSQDKNIKQTFSEDLTRLYSVKPLSRFFESVFKCLNGLPQLIVDNVDFLRLLATITPSEYLFTVFRLALACPKNPVEIAQLPNQQVAFFLEIIASFSYSLKRPMFKTFEKNFKDLLNEEVRISIKKGSFDCLTGLRTIFLEYFSKIGDEVECINLVASFLEIPANLDYFSHSLVVSLPVKTVRNAIKKFLNGFGEDRNLIRNFAGHLKFWKIKKMRLAESQDAFIDALLKGTLSKIAQKLDLTDLYKDLLE